jgi:hypothetical protein
MKNLVLFLFLLSCNYVNAEVSPRDSLVVSTVEQVWKDSGLKDPGDCLYKVGIQTLSEENFLYTCGKSHKLAIGCVQDRRDGSLAGGRKVIYLSTSVNMYKREEALVQMTLHTLCSCTSNKEKDKTDSLQLRPEVWKVTSGDVSVEAKSLELLH